MANRRASSCASDRGWRCWPSARQILAVGTAPDFIIVDGSEGGTGAAPLEFEDHVGMPLTHGLMVLNNALVGTGLRDQIRIGASGKVAGGSDIVKRVIQGADYTNAARAKMMAVGCIQAQRCQTNTCPVGVTTQYPRRVRTLDVVDKSKRVHRYHKATVAQAMQLDARQAHIGRRTAINHALVGDVAETLKVLTPRLRQPQRPYPAGGSHRCRRPLSFHGSEPTAARLLQPRFDGAGP